MKKTLICAAIAGACLTSLPAFAEMTKPEYKAEQDRITADYKMNHDKCKQLSGNAKDVCVSEAKGVEKVAKADLDARNKPSVKATYDARVARADAAFDTAKEKCDDFAGNAKDVCRKDAQAAHERALADAKVERESNNAQNRADSKIADARRNADDDKRSADYKATRERCDALAGDAKDRCVADAKARYGMK